MLGWILFAFLSGLIVGIVISTKSLKDVAEERDALKKELWALKYPEQKR